MVELAQVGEFMRGHVVDERRREHHQAPVEEYSPVAAAAAPTGPRVREADARNAKTVRACQLCNTVAEELQRLPPHPSEHPLAQACSVGESDLEIVLGEPNLGFSMPQRQGHGPSQPWEPCPGLPDERDPPRSGARL